MPVPINSFDDAEAGSTESSRPPFGIAPPGYRLPDTARLGCVRLQVGDLARSLAYYEQILGFRVLQRSKDIAVLGAEADETPLIELHERRDAAPVPRHGRLGLYHFAILLPSRRALGRLIAHLTQQGIRAGMSDHLVSEAVYLHDPDGLGIEIYADRPRSAWRHEEGQLIMATNPLDADDLLHAAGNERWAGMPPGTTIGHVHLFVADLGEAERFYHVGIGFDKTVWSYQGALFFSAGGYHHHLGTNTWAVGALPAKESDARLLEWEIVVPSIGEARRALESLAGTGAETTPTADGGTARDFSGTMVRIRGAVMA